MRDYQLSDCRVTIGRAKSSTLQLRDGQVSNSHAEIVNGFIADVGSTNGTTLNDKPVSQAASQPLHTLYHS